MKTWASASRLLALIGVLACLGVAAPALAKERSIYAPIVEVDAKRGFLFVFETGGGLVILQASKEAKPHVGKLPVGGLIDVVAEQLPGKKALVLKSWKLHSGESECKVFDGKRCK